MRLVLIVDDEPSIRRTMRKILERAGYSVIESANGVDALLQVERSHPDIVITDLHMPGCDGFDLTRSVRQSDGSQPHVIVLSGDDAETVTQGATALGATTLMKPFTREELLAAVNGVSASSGQCIRVLIVDDQPDVSLAYRFVLETEGFVVTEAASGRAALAYLEGHPIDVILTDLYMPDMDGLALLRTLRRRSAGGVPVIVYTGSGLTERQMLLDQARLLGAREALEKPLAAPVLVRAIADAINHAAA